MANLKFFQVESIFCINFIGVILVVNIIGHKSLDELQSYFNFKCNQKLSSILVNNPIGAGFHFN